MFLGYIVYARYANQVVHCCLKLLMRNVWNHDGGSTARYPWDCIKTVCLPGKDLAALVCGRTLSQLINNELVLYAI